MDSNDFVTPSGSTVRLEFLGTDRWPNRDAERYSFTGESVGDSKDKLRVVFVAPRLTDVALQQQGFSAFTADARKDIALLAAVRSFDGVDSLPRDKEGFRYLEMEAPDVLSLLTTPRPLDRDVRRYIARRLYQSFSLFTLRDPVRVSSFDAQLLGAKAIDLLRNAQLLQEEGYLALKTQPTGEFFMTPTAKLVREVEKFGAAKEDAVREPDYVQMLETYPALTDCRSNLELEYRRYSLAVTPGELESVFRAVAPVVEAIAKRLLKAKGSKAQHATLGPVIAEIQNTGLGDISLLAQLNHVLKFSRDLTQHGTALSLPVLRIACANAFELVPQLGALFPRGQAG